MEKSNQFSRKKFKEDEDITPVKKIGARLPSQDDPSLKLTPAQILAASGLTHSTSSKGFIKPTPGNSHEESFQQQLFVPTSKNSSRVKRTRYNPNTQGLQSLQFDSEAPQPPTYQMYQELPESEKAKYEHSYSQFYKKAKQRCDEFNQSRALDNNFPPKDHQSVSIANTNRLRDVDSPSKQKVPSNKGGSSAVTFGRKITGNFLNTGAPSNSIRNMCSIDDNLTELSSKHTTMLHKTNTVLEKSPSEYSKFMPASRLEETLFQGNTINVIEEQGSSQTGSRDPIGGKSSASDMVFSIEESAANNRKSRANYLPNRGDEETPVLSEVSSSDSIISKGGEVQKIITNYKHKIASIEEAKSSSGSDPNQNRLRGSSKKKMDRIKFVNPTDKLQSRLIVKVSVCRQSNQEFSREKKVQSLGLRQESSVGDLDEDIEAESDMSKVSSVESLSPTKDISVNYPLPAAHSEELHHEKPSSFQYQPPVALTMSSTKTADETAQSDPPFKYMTQQRETLNFIDTRDYLIFNQVPCQKYNYTLDKSSQTSDHFLAMLSLSKDGERLIIQNLKPCEYQAVEPELVRQEPVEDKPFEYTKRLTSKPEELMSKMERKQQRSQLYPKANTKKETKKDPDYQEGVMRQLKMKSWDERLLFSKEQSRASGLIRDIKAFIFGGSTSRFWLMRKHINSMDLRTKTLQSKLPFYCWDCISIQMRDRMVDLVIRDEQEMTKLIEFLIVSLQTIDGNRYSGKAFLDGLKESNKGKKNPLLFGQLIKQSELREQTEIDMERFLAEQSLYLSAFRMFNMMRIRMKISFMALTKRQTIQEFLLEGILNSYNYLNSIGKIKDPYPHLKNDDILQRLLVGRADLKLVVWRKMNPQIEDLNEDKKYNELYNDFLVKEIKRLTGKNIQLDIFKDFNHTSDEFGQLQREASTNLDNKYQINRKQMIYNRLDMVAKLGFAKGPTYIQIILERIKVEKQIFALEMENREEVAIPKGLSQDRLPASFRYYDAIIKITQDLVKDDKKKHLSMQMSLIRHFDKQYSWRGLLGLNSPKPKKKKGDLILKQSSKPSSQISAGIDYKESLHTKQIQRSKYLKIDDNLLNFNFDRQARTGNQKPLSEDKIEKHKRDLNKVQLKYLSEEYVNAKQRNLFTAKRNFAHQLWKLKAQGIRLQELQDIDYMLQMEEGTETREGLAHRTRLFMQSKRKIDHLTSRWQKSQEAKQATKMGERSDFHDKQLLVDQMIQKHIRYFSPPPKELPRVVLSQSISDFNNEA